MTYGLPSSIHTMKVGPWTVRLRAATKALDEALRNKNRKMVVYALEDTSFWMGRVTCDAIGAAESAHDVRPYRSAAMAVMNAAESIAKAKVFLSPSRPSYGGGTQMSQFSPLVFLFLAASLILRPVP